MFKALVSCLGSSITLWTHSGAAERSKSRAKLECCPSFRPSNARIFAQKVSVFRPSFYKNEPVWRIGNTEIALLKSVNKMELLSTFIKVRITLPWELSPGSSPNLKLYNPRPLPHLDHNRKGAENRSPSAGAAGWRKSLWTLCWNFQLWNKIWVLEVWAIDTKPEFMKFGMSFEQFKISMKEGVENSITKPLLLIDDDDVKSRAWVLD